MSTQTTSRIAVGSRFQRDDARSYTLDGVKHIHTQTHICEVTATDPIGFAYRVVEVTAEQDRPPFAGKSRPTGGSVAWFVVDRYIDRGELRLLS